MHLTAQRNSECQQTGRGEPAPLESEKHGREQERDEAEEMPRRLGDAVGSEFEREPTEQRGRARPGRVDRSHHAVKLPASDEAEQHEEVVGKHVPGDVSQRPERDSEEPALEVRAGLRLRPERVRVDPGCSTPLELVPGEPEGPAELQVVARDRLAEARCRSGQVVISVEVARCRPRRPHGSREVDDERYEGDAAATMASMSGNGDSVSFHDARTLSPSIRKTERAAIGRSL